MVETPVDGFQSQQRKLRMATHRYYYHQKIVVGVVRLDGLQIINRFPVTLPQSVHFYLTGLGGESNKATKSVLKMKGVKLFQPLKHMRHLARKARLMK